MKTRRGSRLRPNASGKWLLFFFFLKEAKFLQDSVMPLQWKVSELCNTIKKKN